MSFPIFFFLLLTMMWVHMAMVEDRTFEECHKKLLACSQFSIPKTTSGWTGLNQSFEQKEFTAPELDKIGLDEVKWKGDFLVPPPKNKVAWEKVTKQATTAIEKAQAKLDKHGVKPKPGRCGEHQSVTTGVSMGGGQKHPMNIRNGALVGMMSGYIDSVFCLVSPDVHLYYGSTLASVMACPEITGTLFKNFLRTVFAAWRPYYPLGPRFVHQASSWLYDPDSFGDTDPFESGGPGRNDFMMQEPFLAKATPAERKTWDDDKVNRWREGVAMHTPFSELRKRRSFFKKHGYMADSHEGSTRAKQVPNDQAAAISAQTIKLILFGYGALGIQTCSRIFRSCRGNDNEIYYYQWTETSISGKHCAIILSRPRSFTSADGVHNQNQEEEQKGPPTAPRFHLDTLSSDGRRIQHSSSEMAPPSPLKKRIIEKTTAMAHEHFEGMDFNEGPALPFAGLYDEEKDVHVDGEGKAKCYVSSDEPLKQWMPHHDSYLEEMISGQASSKIGQRCSHCLGEGKQGIASMRCRDCFDMELWWNGQFFEQVRLRELGLRVQLGHGGNHRCPQRKEKPIQFTVIDCHGIHTVSVDFCHCSRGSTAGQEYKQLLRNKWFPSTHLEPKTATTFRCLEQFHMLKLTGKVTPFDYYTGLQRLTDNTGCHKVPDQYRPFLRMGREFRHLRACKRAGRAHDAEHGIAETKPGELAVECPACPHPGDPGLGTGWAYFVEEEPYQEYVKTLGDQEEENTCTGLSAVDHANTRYSRGYAVTGVGLVLCARHEFVGKNAAGDLQVGEKFGNMTYFYKNFIAQVKELPPLVRFRVVMSLFKWVIPKLHILGHRIACQLAFNLNYMLGAGRTDGEGVERPWAKIGPVATSTREMGPGHRHDILDDHWHDWNWRKIVGLARLLRQRLIDAEEELEVQQENFGSFLSNQQEEVPVWRNMVEQWEENPEKRNPYEQRKTKEEAMARAGMPGLNKCSPAEFLIEAMDIEEQQRKLRREVARLRLAGTTKQMADLNNKRNKVIRAITLTVQMLEESRKAEGCQIVMAEDVKILFPSDLTAVERCRGGMAEGLDEIEKRLRDAQCRDALGGLRNQLLIKSQLLTYRHYNVRHQGMLMCSRSMLDRNEEKIALCAKHYEAGWEAKVKLSNGDLVEVGWKKLLAGDIRPMQDVEETKKEMEKRQKRKRKRDTKDPEAELGDMAEVVDPVRQLGSRKTLSWIWTESGASGCLTDEALEDGLCIEWSKAWARLRRWREEVHLLKEEMQRVLVFLEWKTRWWIARAEMAGFEGVWADGARAYAMRQASIQKLIRARCLELWEEFSIEESQVDVDMERSDVLGGEKRRKEPMEEEADIPEGDFLFEMEESIWRMMSWTMRRWRMHLWIQMALIGNTCLAAFGNQSQCSIMDTRQCDAYVPANVTLAFAKGGQDMSASLTQHNSLPLMPNKSQSNIATIQVGHRGAAVPWHAFAT
ncbi:hypothetical protein C8J56DRAFT_890663 [Mycena floridula]|nr:hypothetical protein C8J56DRAFT_890663 [Mycena floridula]